MKTFTIASTLRSAFGAIQRGTVIALISAAMTAGSAVAAAPATAAPAPAPPAVPGVPDVGRPGEVTGPKHIRPTPPRRERAVSAQGWTTVKSRVAGARIRAVPVKGTVLGLIPQAGIAFAMLCKQRASDGYYWGWANYRGTRGWVRSDLWYEIQWTSPNGGHMWIVPRC